MTGQSNSSQGCGRDRLPNWNPKNGGMLVSQPVTSCLTNHSELCMSCLLNNQSRRISIYRLQWQPSLGFESSVFSTLMTSDHPVVVVVSNKQRALCVITLDVLATTWTFNMTKTQSVRLCRPAVIHVEPAWSSVYFLLLSKNMTSHLARITHHSAGK